MGIKESGRGQRHSSLAQCVPSDSSVLRTTLNVCVFLQQTLGLCPRLECPDEVNLEFPCQHKCEEEERNTRVLPTYGAPLGHTSPPRHGRAPLWLFSVKPSGQSRPEVDVGRV